MRSRRKPPPAPVTVPASTGDLRRDDAAEAVASLYVHDGRQAGRLAAYTARHGHDTAAVEALHEARRAQIAATGLTVYSAAWTDATRPGYATA